MVRFHNTWTTAVLYALAGLLIVASNLGAATEYGRPPLRFEQNRGQTHADVLFLARGARQRVFLTRDAATLQVLGSSGDSVIESVVTIRPLGATSDVRVKGEAARASTSRYIGAAGSVEAPQFGRVRYESIYPGVDWVFYGAPDRRLEHDFIVAAGEDAGKIRLAIEGAERLRLNARGGLTIETAAGELELLRPIAYQVFGGERRSTAVEFVLAADGVVSFGLGDYDRSRELVIDPVLSYARYLGGAGADNAAAVKVNAEGQAFVVGATRSLDFPASAGAVQGAFAGGLCGGSIVAQPCFDVFVAKLTADGSDIEWATYLGGTGNDLAMGATLDGGGGLIVAGTTDSTDFPASAGALRGAISGGGNDAFVFRLDGAGSLLYATLLGGSGVDQAVGVAADDAGAAYVAGHTKSNDFPTTAGAFQTSDPSGGDRTAVFVAKLSPDGGSLVYSTLLAGALEDRAGGVAVNADGEAYVTGSTGSADFPVTRGNPFGGRAPLQASLNGTAADAFVARLSADGSGLVYATYLGGTGSEAGKRIEVAADGSAFVVGSTDSRDFPTTPGALLPVWKRSLGFAAKLDPDGSAAAYSTYLVGSADELAVDAEGAAYVGGVSGSSSPFGGAVVPACNGSLLRKIAPNGRQLLYSGFVPGLGAIDVGADGLLYTAGTDASGGLTTTGGPSAGGQTDVYAAKLEVGTATGISLTCVEHGASFFPGEAAPGQILSLFGSGLGRMQPAGLTVENGTVTTESDGVRVLFDGVPAPLLFVWWNQINVVTPYSVDGKERVTIQVERDGELSEPFEMPVAAAHPGLFTRNSTGAGLGALLNQDGTINRADNPAAAGSVVSFFGTGEGQTSPAGVDGLVTPETASGLPRPKLAVTVEIGTQTAEVLYAGAAPGFVSGVLQINARIPAAVGPGAAPVRVTIGGRLNRQPVFVEVE